MLRILIAGSPARVEHYLAAMQAVGMEAVAALEGNPADFDGLILPGGGDVDPALYGQTNWGKCGQIEPEQDGGQFSLLRAFAAAEKPALCVCKGIQVLNVCFGGTLVQDLSVASAHAWQGDFQYHDLLCEPGSLLHRLYGSRTRVNSAHHQGVGSLGRGLRITAKAPDGTIEALEHEALPLFGVQFHPERMAFANRTEKAVDGAPLFRVFRAIVEGRKAQS